MSLSSSFLPASLLLADLKKTNITSVCACVSVCQRCSQFVNVLEAEITDPGGCVYTKVGEGRTLGGALRAHTLTTVPTVVL